MPKNLVLGSFQYKKVSKLTNSNPKEICLKKVEGNLPKFLMVYSKGKDEDQIVKGLNSKIHKFGPAKL